MAQVHDPPPVVAEPPNPVYEALGTDSVRRKLHESAKAYLWNSGCRLNHSERANRAEDLAAEAQRIALSRAGDYDPAIASVTTWIESIIRNLARTNAARTKAQAGGDAVDRVADPTASVQEQLVRAADGAEVRTALAKLDAVNRQIAELRYVEDLSHAEIAGRLGMTAGAIRTRLSRALDELHGILSPSFQGGRS